MDRWPVDRVQELRQVLQRADITQARENGPRHLVGEGDEQIWTHVKTCRACGFGCPFSIPFLLLVSIKTSWTKLKSSRSCHMYFVITDH